jgi:hypothetical protein
MRTRQALSDFIQFTTAASSRLPFDQNTCNSTTQEKQGESEEFFSVPCRSRTGMMENGEPSRQAGFVAIEKLIRA